MQHDNFRNLNKVIFTHWKYLESWVNAFWYRFSLIKRYTFHCFMKSALVWGNQGTSEILQLFDRLPFQSLVLLFYSSVMISFLDESDGVSLKVKVKGT